MGNSHTRPHFASSPAASASPFSAKDSTAMQSVCSGVSSARTERRTWSQRRFGPRLEASWTEPPSSLDMPSPFSSVEWRTDFHEQFDVVETDRATPCLVAARETGERLSLETFDRQRNSVMEAEKFRRLDRELSVRQAVHPCTVANPMRGCYLTKDAYAVVSDRSDGRTLRAEIQEVGPTSERMAAAVVHSVLEILRMCRVNRIVHMNVTPEAFRLRDRDADPFKLPHLCFAPSGWLKATDFEHSRYIFHGDRLGDYWDDWRLPSGGRYSRRQPSPLYLAPEVFAASYAYEADMWSLGILAYELLTNRFPFWPTKKEALLQPERNLRVAVDDREPDFSALSHASSTCQDFIYGCLQKNPYERMHVADGTTHPWIERRVKKRELPNHGVGYAINPDIN